MEKFEGGTGIRSDVDRTVVDVGRAIRVRMRGQGKVELRINRDINVIIGLAAIGVGHNHRVVGFAGSRGIAINFPFRIAFAESNKFFYIVFLFHLSQDTFLSPL